MFGLKRMKIDNNDNNCGDAGAAKLFSLSLRSRACAVQLYAVQILVSCARASISRDKAARDWNAVYLTSPRGQLGIADYCELLRISI